MSGKKIAASSQKKVANETVSTQKRGTYKFAAGKDIYSSYDSQKLENDFHLARDIITKQGFDGVPEVVSPTELDEYIKENGTPEMFRGYGCMDADRLSSHAEQFLSGDMHLSGEESSLYGAGIYTTTSDRIARGYAEAKKGANEAVPEHNMLERMTLRKDAKVLEVSMLFSNDKSEKPDVSKYMYGMLADCKLSNYAVAKGYDAVKVPQMGGQTYIVILNRTAVITDGVNHY